MKKSNDNIELYLIGIGTLVFIVAVELGVLVSQFKTGIWFLWQ